VTALSADPPAIVIESLSQAYAGGPAVLDEISLTIEPGCFVCLIGPSGCGKSTLLRLIAGLLKPTQGRVKSAPATPVPPGFLFQESTLLPWKTVRANVALPLRLQHVPRADWAGLIDPLLDMVKLQPVADYYPRQLSGGMKMRVALARALMRRPGLMLLDEPFGALDEMTRDQLNEDLLALRQQTPFTACHVTHSVSEAVFLADRILVMTAQPGRIVADIPVRFTTARRDPSLRESTDFQKTVANVTHALRTANGGRR
jgi:NitT/TauT family transport system ATP-binding protein